MKHTIFAMFWLALMSLVTGCGSSTHEDEMDVLMRLGKALKHYSSDNDYAYPASLDDPAFLDDERSSAVLGQGPDGPKRPFLGLREAMRLKNPETGEIAKPWYVRGHSADTPSGNVLLASPWVYGGRRVVVWTDYSAKVMEESRFQDELAKTLEMDGRELLK